MTSQEELKRQKILAAKKKLKEYREKKKGIASFNSSVSSGTVSPSVLSLVSTPGIESSADVSYRKNEHLDGISENGFDS
ncbi:hypothetical protein BB560_004857, partial [Smittium megazygosporum]